MEKSPDLEGARSSVAEPERKEAAVMSRESSSLSGKRRKGKANNRNLSVLPRASIRFSSRRQNGTPMAGSDADGRKVRQVAERPYFRRKFMAHFRGERKFI